MSGTEQLFLMVVVPAAIVAVIWALASIGGPKAQKRYRPGRPFEFHPVWYVANHRRAPASGATALTAPHRAELTAAPTPAPSQGMQGTTGGASDRW